ncbi:o-succinylbenzoate synthase [Ureibacillus thermophilus]|uniref:o-succinylbenzoate synthase n=1 Tax=Ureibacillus thermophilus TaxID=367743 RepID=UPI00361041F8
MKINQVIVRYLKMPMKHSFTTSFGTIQDKSFLLLEILTEEGIVGFGECVAFEAPWYTEETVKTCWHMLEDFLIPILSQKEIHHPNDASKWFSGIRRNNMAKAAIEGALWDIYAQKMNQPLAKVLGGNKEEIDVGISLGIQPTIEKQIEVVGKYIEEGYKRIKVKIKPDWDVEVIRKLREAFPKVPMMADANSAYTLKDLNILKQLDEFDLMMIEQPLAYDDIVDHSILQKQLKTPICLDESILSLEDARKAIELESCGVINIKIGRVGGISEAIKIHDYCESKGIPVWCGGMLEAGIGRAHNIALTALSNFELPGDTAGSNHYFEEDIIHPEVVVTNGTIQVPQTAGIGYEPNRKAIEKYTISSKTYLI